MPNSYLLKQANSPSNATAPSLLRTTVPPCLDAKNIVYIGLRDVDRGEVEALKRLNIAHFTMEHVDELGIHEVMVRALAHLPASTQLHVSFDVDSVDEMYIPSTGTPVPAGLTVRELLCIGSMVAKSGRLCSMDVVEFNPRIGDSNQVRTSAKNIIEIVSTFVGKSRMSWFDRTAL